MGAMGTFELLNTSTHIVAAVASRDAEPDQLHDARRTRVDVQHTTWTRGARLCVQGDRGSRRRLKNDAPGDAERGAEDVGAGGKDDAADGGVGECTGQVGGGAHRGLQLTAVAGHKGRRGDAVHDRPGAHDDCGVRELSPIMLAAQVGSSELRRRRSWRRQRAESAVVERGREWRRHYGEERRHRRMCRGRHGDDPVQESSSHRSQTTSTFGRQTSSEPKQRPHTAPQQVALSPGAERVDLRA
jgi:hypothetical protein